MYFILVNGELVKASIEDILNPDVEIYDEKGNEVVRPEVEVKVDEAEEKVDEEEEDAAINALNKTVEKLSDAMAQFGNEVADLKKANKAREIEGQKAFPIDPGESGVVETGETDEVVKFIGSHYDLKRQGKDLQDKLAHPLHQTSDEVLPELQKYFCLIAMASKRHPTSNSLKAIDFLEKLYGNAPEVKTVIGDTGNVFPIPDIVDEEILHFAREKSIILQFGRTWEMTSDKQSFPLENAAVSVGWGNTTSESEPGITETELDAEELSAYSAVRNTTLADARSDVVSWLAGALAEAAGLELDNKAWNGVGTDDPFICSGILSAACGYSVSLASGSTAFSQLSATKLSEMIGKLDGMKKDGARFCLHGSVLHFVRDLKDDNGRPIFVETVGSSVPGTIWGYPYTETIKCPSTSGAATAFISFGNLRYFQVGRRLGASALDVDPYGLWTTNRTRYKLYQRWALNMGLTEGFVRLLTAAS